MTPPPVPALTASRGRLRHAPRALTPIEPSPPTPPVPPIFPDPPVPSPTPPPEPSPVPQPEPPVPQPPPPIPEVLRRAFPGIEHLDDADDPWSAPPVTFA